MIYDSCSLSWNANDGTARWLLALQNGFFPPGILDPDTSKM